jgi:dihydrofolate reductase
MGKVITEFTMSLDGFVADANHDIRSLFGWYRNGDTEFQLPSSTMTFKVSRASADLLRRNWAEIGALVTGRRDFDVSHAWGGISPFGVPILIITHRLAPEWEQPGSPFIFVRDGIEQALAQAQRIAGDKVVGISGTTIVQQCLRAGLLDGIRIHLAPVLLGAGIPLFATLGIDPIHLAITEVVATPTVTHLEYVVLKKAQ